MSLGRGRWKFPPGTQLGLWPQTSLSTPETLLGALRSGLLTSFLSWESPAGLTLPQDQGANTCKVSCVPSSAGTGEEDGAVEFRLMAGCPKTFQSH